MTLSASLSMCTFFGGTCTCSSPDVFLSHFPVSNSVTFWYSTTGSILLVHFANVSHHFHTGCCNSFSLSMERFNVQSRVFIFDFRTLYVVISMLKYYNLQSHYFTFYILILHD